MPRSGSFRNRTPRPREPSSAPHPPEVSPRSSRFENLFGHPRALATILVLAAGLRLTHLIALRATFFFDELQLDARAYDEWAQRIADGAFIGNGPFFVDPLYAYFLGAIYRYFGHNLLLVRVLQMGLGVFTCALTARIGRRVLGSIALANLAALIVALYIPLIHSEATIEKTSLGVFLATFALERWLAQTPRSSLTAGVVLGLGALARGNLLLFVPVGTVALLVDRTSRDRWKRAGFFLVGASAVVLLAAAHNMAAGEFALTTTNVGQNLYIAYHQGNQDGTYASPPFVRPDPQFEESDFRAEAERESGHALSAAQVSSYWRRLALGEMGAAPLATVGRSVRKLRLFFDSWETPDNENIELVATFSPVLRLPIVWMGALFPLALIGAAVTWRRPGVRVILMAALLYAGSVVAFFVVSRFRLPVVPELALLAAAGIWALIEAFRTRRWPVVAPGIVLATVVVLVLAIRPAWLQAHRRSGLAIAYNNLGAQLVAKGDDERAIEAYERAIEIDERAVVGSLRALGDLYIKRGQYSQAERSMRRVVEIKPESRLGHEALIRLYGLMLRDPNRRSDPTLTDKLAVAERGAGHDHAVKTQPSVNGARAQELKQLSEVLGREKRWSDAIAALQEANEIGSYDEGARYELGRLMEQYAPAGELISYWSQQVAKDAKPQTSYYFWAVGLQKSGDLDGAVSKLRAGLETDPAHEMSENRWGLILESQKRLPEALDHFMTAAEIFPDFRDAHENAARILDALHRPSDAKTERERARSSDPSTKRRYVYWARWLIQKGRRDAAASELNRAVRADPSDAEARALLATLQAPVSTGVAGSAHPPDGELLPSDRGANLIARLRQVSSGAPVWLALDETNPESTRLADKVEAAFVEAGWVVRGKRRLPYRPKAGVFLYAADERPPDYVNAAFDGLRLAGLAPTFATGYRAYYEERRRAQPGYQGISMDANQTFVIVVGPRPPRP